MKIKFNVQEINMLKMCIADELLYLKNSKKDWESRKGRIASEYIKETNDIISILETLYYRMENK